MLTALCLLLAPGPTAAQGDDDPAAAKRHAIRESAFESSQPPQSSHPDAELRKALERGTVAGPAHTQRPAAADLVEPPAPDARRRLLEQHDWDADLAAGGTIEAGLQLSLSAPRRPYRVGGSFELFLALASHRSAPTVLDELTACGTFDRADGIAFRVHSDTGGEVLANLVHKDVDERHAHASLRVEAQGRLRTLVDLAQLAATSPELQELLLGASRIEVSAEIPALGLTSNPVSIDVEHR